MRILGLDAKGREIIHHIKNNTEMIVITNLSKDLHLLSANDQEILATEQKAYALYHLFDHYDAEDSKLKPLILS